MKKTTASSGMGASSAAGMSIGGTKAPTTGVKKGVVRVPSGTRRAAGGAIHPNTYSTKAK